MRTTIIPAQITTVEDKIAGSLNFAQIILLMIPVLWGTLLYALFAPAMKLASYKISLVLLVSAISLFLAIRVKNKIIAEWIGVLLRYKVRPKIYIFDKNNITERMIDVPPEPVMHHKKVVVKTSKIQIKELSIKELIKFEQAMASKHLAVSFRYGRKSL